MLGLALTIVVVWILGPAALLLALALGIVVGVLLLVFGGAVTAGLLLGPWGILGFIVLLVAALFGKSYHEYRWERNHVLTAGPIWTPKMWHPTYLHRLLGWERPNPLRVSSPRPLFDW